MAGALPPFVLGYDGSFVGFLCAAAEAINTTRTGSPTPSIKGFSSPGELFDESIHVRSDRERAQRLWRRLARRASQEALQHCLEAFCSDYEGKEDAIAYALGRISLEGKSALCDLAHPLICTVEKAALRSRNQAHLIAGLLRFSELADGSWYALIAPDCDILPLIAGHFAARYSDMVFTVYDKRHSTALFHNPKKGYAIATGVLLSSGGSIPLSERERLIRDEWTEYFESVAIAQRKNLRLQANHMPKKYWPLIAQYHLF
ncbi:MAG: TIGR03915 family putative DNA repair protein [Rectinemataceae bacterium]|nr:TIGR03915 family putative DNA repair protein [Rectinemataceae bacterium]